MTDGAVGNTDSVIELIKKNNSSNRVHTFGIGQGVSTSLIKGCALAGMGHYSFITKLTEIESKVV